MSFPEYPKYKDSGVEWLGKVPEHWGLAKFRHRFAESPEKIETEVVGPMLSVSGYRGIEVKEYDDENRRRSDEELVGYRIARPGQLIVNSMWLNAGGLGVSAFEGHVSPAYRCYWIDDSINRRYVHHLMRSARYVDGYTSMVQGIRPNSLQLSRDDLMSLVVLIPPSTEQTAIATFLDRETAKIDALVAEQERLIALLKEKRQAVISHAVTKGLNPDAPMKDSGIEWLGQVPAHWSKSKLKYAASFISGGTPSKAVLAYWDGDVPWASSKDLKAEKISDTGDHITDKAVEDGAGLINVGDLMIVVRGMILAHTFPVTKALRPMAINQDLKAVRPHADWNNDYFASLLRATSPETFRRLDEAGHGTKALRMDAWLSLEIPQPPKNEQTEIASFLESETAKIDALMAEAERAIALLQERRSALISAAVTGQIDVRALEATP